MEYFGYILKSSEIQREWGTFIKVIIAVEPGFSLDILPVYVFEDELKDSIKHFDEGSMVHANIEVSGRYLKLKSITQESFTSCSVCGMVSNGLSCKGCLKTPHKRLSGQWTVLSAGKHPSCDGYKIVLQQSKDIITFVSFYSSHHFNICKNLQTGAVVDILGWLNSERHVSLRIINPV